MLAGGKVLVNTPLGLFHPVVVTEVALRFVLIMPKMTLAYVVSPRIPTGLFHGFPTLFMSVAVFGGLGPKKIPSVDVPIPFCIVYVPAGPVTYAVNVVGVELRIITVCPLRKLACKVNPVSTKPSFTTGTVLPVYVNTANPPLPIVTWEMFMKFA
jgi:hypothetical protein